MKRQVVVVSLVLALVMALMVAGTVLGKGHVPAGQVQVSHKGRVAMNVDAPSLKAHLGHGDLQLPACDFNNVFHAGDDTSNVVSSDFSGVLYADGTFVPRRSAEGITPACPPGTF
jgi:hypothetical protein